MRAYCVLLHIFAALLLCDYGMFSTPLPYISEMATAAISNISHPNTTVATAESTIGLYADYGDNGQSDLATNTSDDETPTSGISSTVFERVKNATGKTPLMSSTAHPRSTTDNVKRTTQGIGVKNKGSESLTGGIIILIFILILIVCLLVILYFLRKKARSYSFDLTRVDIAPNDYVDTPLRSNQQGISYEQTNKDLSVCLDYGQEDKSEEKTSPIANGSAGEKTEQTPTNENDYQNFPEENSFSSDSSLASPMKKVEFNLDLDLLESDSEFNCTTEAEATDADQNENNNNVSNAGQGTAAEIFTEINLDEPKEHATV